MSVRLRYVARAGVAPLVSALSAWQPSGCYVEGLHAGDVGWQLRMDDDVADRVAVQRSAFAKSTFTVARWHQLAEGPGYDATLDLVRRTPDGSPAAAATGWSAGPGKCGILEPVGTSPDHAGQGHGRGVSLAVMAALARAGASGVTVHTALERAGGPHLQGLRAASGRGHARPVLRSSCLTAHRPLPGCPARSLSDCGVGRRPSLLAARPRSSRRRCPAMQPFGPVAA